MKPFVSVIVPTYNTKDYFLQCIDSLLMQTYDNYELLLIDDGSTDGCGDLCDEYADKDERVRVIHQSNQGLVAARRKGIESARGEYVTYIDSDDWVEKDYLETLMRHMTDDVDLLVSNVIYDKGDERTVLYGYIAPDRYHRNEYEEKLYPALIRDWRTGKPGIQPFVVGKVFRREKLETFLHICDERITLGEDGATVYPYILSSQMIEIIQYAGYHWVIHGGSMSRTHSIEVVQRIQYLQSYLEGVFSGAGLYDTLKPQLDSWILKEFLLPAIKSIYGIEAGAISCIPPYELLQYGERIVIYGAGNAGRTFVRCLLRSGYVKVVGWVDQKVRGTMYDVAIKHPSALQELEYDKVIIAVYSKETAHSIKTYLESVGIPEGKIVWKEYDWG